jgi:hypothetical protein
MREPGLFDFKADAQRGLAQHFLHLRQLGGSLMDLA